MASGYPELIPPSMFQSNQPPPDPWQGLAQVSKEVSELRKETKKLRSSESTDSSSCKKQNQPGIIDYNRRYPANDEFKYANELISRQANELSELKSEIRNLNQKYDDEKRHFERELVEKDRESKLRVSSLEDLLTQKEDQYDREVDRLSYEHEQTTDKLTDKINSLTQELDLLHVKNNRQMKELTDRIQTLEEEKNSITNQLNNNLREKENEVESLTKQVHQLKSYIGETEKSHRPTQVWRKENETLMNKLQTCEAEQENLKSKNELTNVRLSAMGEILAVQEADISKSKIDGHDKKNLENILLTRWREKVFRLMVQNKSNEINMKKSDSDWKNKYCNLSEELTSARHEIEVLKFQNSEKTAQIDLEKMNTKNVLDELSTTQQVAVCLDNQLTENTGNMELLKSVAESLDKKLNTTMKKISTSLSVLKSYGDRISFASGRVELLQGQFARKEALRKLDSKTQSMKAPLEDEMSSESHIKTELEKVTKERDYVTSQLKQVSELLNDRLADTKQQSIENEKEIEKEKYRSDMIEMEKQVNQAKREQTKAVVSLRQLEKQGLREKERLNEQIKISENHYTKEIDKLSEQLKTIEKERNLMMATLRQEGLLNKYKQDRGEPITLDVTDDTVEDSIKSSLSQQIKSDHTEPTNDLTALESKEEEMNSVINDLKSLAAVIDDNSSDSDESSVHLPSS
ncbi:hypothetical protein LOTGIDRAFT_238673 [Lottia gigantea]|uniref:Coiled-coil alpha-helical rod protein 1 n=1 Tax=Lottia gigantea TaxID=225164 RepID=V4AYJ7_LOTGI|nr:hypothetical protein LOTGIDRAFT_238673 [Lottia gigantea]ESP00176.1 hypothetical protein LOTGIDRAFT_238673 [Lottia gigantea]